MSELHELKSGLRVRGLVATGDVTIIVVEEHGSDMVNVVYRDDSGQISDRLLTAEQAAGVEVASGWRWSFDADGAAFKLASEARRIELAHLFDPFAALEASTIAPLPHQIEAVYGRLLRSSHCASFWPMTLAPARPSCRASIFVSSCCEAISTDAWLLHLGASSSSGKKSSTKSSVFTLRS